MTKTTSNTTVKNILTIVLSSMTKTNFLTHILAVVILVGATAVSTHAQALTRKQFETTGLVGLRNNYVKATKEYKVSLAKLQAIYENNVRKSEEHLAQSKILYSEQLISKPDLIETEVSVVAAKDKVNEVRQQMATADAQIAYTLAETPTAAEMSRLYRKYLREYRAEARPTECRMTLLYRREGRTVTLAFKSVCKGVN